jgi:sugar lactone lactonase YvrE
MNTNRAASARLGVLLGVLLLGALIFVSGCSNNTSNGTALPGQKIYVIQDTSVSVFPLTASGNVAPTATLSGANTGLHGAHRLAFDTLFSGYVTNADTDTVTIYAAGTSGNALPTATISGAATGLDRPEGIDLDSANNIYVANRDTPSITVYAPGSTGDATPTSTISGADTGLVGPNGLALDGGRNIYVADEVGNTVIIFAAGSTGDMPPLLTISGGGTGLSTPHALTVDGAGNLYVTNDGGGNSVTIYSAKAIGGAINAAAACIALLAPPPTPAQELACSVQNLAPTATIVGAATKLNNPNGIAFDDSGNFYVTNSLNSVMIYSAADIAAAIKAGGANNVAPVATITGANTGFASVHGVNVQSINQ